MCKKRSKAIIFLCISLLISPSAKPATFDIEGLDLEAIALETQPITRSPESKKLVQEIAQYLSNYIKEPLWANTRVPAVRDVLYLMPQQQAHKKGITASFFYNEVHNMQLTVGNLLREDAIANRDELINLLLPNQDPEERATMIALFQKISLQEHRIGTKVNASYTWGSLATHLSTSLLIDERNCWLNKRNRTALLTILNIDESQIPKKEFYKVRLGIGDTSVALGLNALKGVYGDVAIGLQATIPTSRLTYAPRYETNVENLATITDLDSLQQASMSTLRNIRNYLIDPRFGNSGHVSIGAYIAPQATCYNNHLRLWARLSFDVLVAADEDRLFFFKQTIKPEGLTINASESAASQQAFDYLRQYTYPTSFRVTVKPGGIFNGTVAGNTRFGKVLCTTGYNFYAQQREHIKKVVNATTSLVDLKVNEAEAVQVLQHKLFAEALYKAQKPVEVGLGGDVTVASTGLGKDWTVYIKSTIAF